MFGMEDTYEGVDVVDACTEDAVAQLESEPEKAFKQVGGSQ